MMIALSTLLLVFNLSAQEKVTSWTGHLADAMCASTWKGEAGAYKAKRHTRECAFHEKCQASGFGVYTGGTFVPFDDASNARAIAFLRETKQKDDIRVLVKGTVIDGSIRVVSIERAPADASTQPKKRTQ
jgi:hypothetical protein